MLGDVFVLHGGTALNVFHDRTPRLSVDIDLMFVGAADAEGMRAMRPKVDERFREVVGALGYVVQGTNDEHSGQTYRVKYPGDHVKVDISYLARVPMLEAENRTVRADSAATLEAQPGIGNMVGGDPMTRRAELTKVTYRGCKLPAVSVIIRP